MFFNKALIERTKYLFDDNFILGYRMGGNEPSLDDGIEIAKYVEKLGVVFLHVSSGAPDPKFKQEVKIGNFPEDFPLDWVIYMGTVIKKYVNIPVIGVEKKIKTEKEASWLIKNNLLDCVAVGRAMIFQPHWMVKAQRKLFTRETGKKMKVNSIDIFCEIIDNFGDIGVVYRISKELKKIFKMLE